MYKSGQRVLAALRQMIASGELVAGERIAEIPTAERLEVSRTPVRIAFRTLEQEGLLCKAPGRGYTVRAVTDDDIAGAVEVRGVLEGLAARQAAERGLSEDIRSRLHACLVEGDRLFERGHVVMEELEIYHDLNKRFHQAIIEASGNSAIAVALSRNDHLPFASDLRGFLGLDESVNPGYDKVSFVVRLHTDATRERVEELHNNVLKTSVNFANFSKAIHMVPTLEVRAD